jgi:hypothetical protein
MQEILLHTVDIEFVVKFVIIVIATTIGGLIGLFVTRRFARVQKRLTENKEGMSETPEIYVHTEYSEVPIRENTRDVQKTEVSKEIKNQKAPQRKVKKIIVR